MSKKSDRYWARRLAEQEQRVQDINEAYLQEVEKELIAYQQDVIADINQFYARYAKDNQMTLAEAEKYLTNNELEIFQNINLREFRRLALDERTEEAYINALSFRHRITRKEALLKEIEAKTLKLFGNKDGLADYVYKNMGQVYGESKIAITKGIGEVGITARKPLLDLQTVSNRLQFGWHGKNLSETIWGHEEKLYSQLSEVLNDGLSNNRRMEDIIDDVIERTGVAKTRAETLVRTESTAFNSLGARDEFQNQFVEYYKCVVTMDHRTSKRCSDIHKADKRYRVEDYEINVTAPPFHVRCRTYIVPDFGDELESYFEVDDDYDGPELDDVLNDLSKELSNTLSQINSQLF